MMTNKSKEKVPRIWIISLQASQLGAFLACIYLTGSPLRAKLGLICNPGHLLLFSNSCLAAHTAGKVHFTLSNGAYTASPSHSPLTRRSLLWRTDHVLDLKESTRLCASTLRDQGKQPSKTSTLSLFGYSRSRIPAALKWHPLPGGHLRSTVPDNGSYFFSPPPLRKGVSKTKARTLQWL